MSVTVSSSGPRGRKTYEIRWKNGELYDYTDNAQDARRKAARARKEEKEWRERRNPGKRETKAERLMRLQRTSRKRAVANAAGNLLKRLNPGTKVHAVKLKRLKGGGVTLTPVKSNIAEGFYRDGVFHPIRAASDYNVVRAGEARSSSAKDLAARARRRQRRK